MEICFKRETWKEGVGALTDCHQSCFTWPKIRPRWKSFNFNSHHMEKRKSRQAHIPFLFLRTTLKVCKIHLWWSSALPCTYPPPKKTCKKNLKQLQMRRERKKEKISEFYKENFRVAQDLPVYKYMKIQNHPWCWTVKSCKVQTDAVNGTAPSQPLKGRWCQVLTGWLGSWD